MELNYLDDNSKKKFSVALKFIFLKIDQGVINCIRHIELSRISIKESS